MLEKENGSQSSGKAGFWEEFEVVKLRLFSSVVATVIIIFIKIIAVQYYVAVSAVYVSYNMISSGLKNSIFWTEVCIMCIVVVICANQLFVG